MSKPAERNYGHSVYTRLLAFAGKHSLDCTFALQEYAMERLLYRMSKSTHSECSCLSRALYPGRVGVDSYFPVAQAG